MQEIACKALSCRLGPSLHSSVARHIHSEADGDGDIDGDAAEAWAGNEGEAECQADCNVVRVKRNMCLSAWINRRNPVQGDAVKIRIFGETLGSTGSRFG